MIVFEAENIPEINRICIYSIETIQKQFNHNIEKCFHRNRLKINADLTKCQWKNITCGGNLDWDDLIKNNPLINLNRKITSIMADWINDNLVIFLGTKPTTILKYTLKLPLNPKTFTEMILFDELKLVQSNDKLNRQPLLSDMFIFKNFLFVMTSKKVN